MRVRPLFVILTLGGVPVVAADLPPLAPDVVKPAAPIAVEPFDLADVRLLDGPFRDAMERDLGYLLQLEPDRLLHTFRLNVNLPTSAEPYGGWEGPDVELRGHTLGHYLSACALMYRSTGNVELKRRIDTIVGELAKCQAASPAAGFREGYLSAFPESFIDRVEAGTWVWAPWYTLHKIMAGLLDAYQRAGSAQALDVLRHMAGWVKVRVDRLTTEQMQAALKMEFGGMNEVLANLYGVTGDPEHLRLARAFDHAAVFDPLARGEDPLNGLHANTQIPKAIGAAREFELTGEARYRDIARNFWTEVARHRSYVIGGHSDREHFFPVTDFARHVSTETTETCNTYNMLKLTRHLFAWQPDAAAMDFYERGLYNHILASQDPALGRFVYLMPLASGSYKNYSTATNSFWCCVGTGMENHAKYGDTIFLHDAGALWVNLFIPAEVTWRERGVTLRQETDFPNADSTRLSLQLHEPTQFALRVRHPGWATAPLRVSVNGRTWNATSQPGSYEEIKRTWRDGDSVEVKFDLHLRVENLPGTSDVVALLYGPIVLAGQLGQADMPNPYVRDQTPQARYPLPDAPALVTAATDTSWLSQVGMVSRSPLLFRTRDLVRPADVTLVPFHRVHQERHAIYWHVYTPDAWDERVRAVAAVEDALKALNARAVDRVQPGDPVSEAAHGFEGSESDSGTLSGRTWRQARQRGSFSYRLHTGGREDLTLVCAFGAKDVEREFSVLVDGTPVAAPRPDGTAPGDVFVDQYVIPAELLRGKATITVTFQPDDRWGTVTANVFACALVPANAP